ncbi:hypothetical protein J4050_05010 [Winogradskyella sp. DF17]|uniref:Uncharacterized protein n=1 Tax=Winogradskyella pelagia TaxID=2819984 RepID=A0ABS3T1F0_9FLAO|nr:DUF6090 family protein [Winogradskyella sp. DF17]MBO3116094.1 hypothetical protein [Winogradskyella sp. DF17]
MIKFFRQIRKNLMEQNKTSRYFKYAIGEIVLVVIGILIALQVNNWNENRTLEHTQTRYLKQLATDIDSMGFQYKGIVKYTKANHLIALGVYSNLKSCEISDDQKINLDQLLITYNELGKLFQIRDTYEEMLSANLLAGIEDKQLKSIITEFFAQRDAMMLYINDYQRDLSMDYQVIKDHVVFGFDTMNQPTVEYEVSKLCQSPDFINAIVEVTRKRENLYRMTQILSQKLEQMHSMQLQKAYD